LFGNAVMARNTLYEKAIFKSYSLPVPVVSVGNISVGGTGKTSFVIWLLRQLTQKGFKVGVISRGYGGQITAVSEVPANGAAHVFGDEPCLIAKENLGPVFVGPDRVKVGKTLLKHYAVDFIIADDAFQHRRLKRDIDVVLI